MVRGRRKRGSKSTKNQSPSLFLLPPWTFSPLSLSLSTVAFRHQHSHHRFDHCHLHHKQSPDHLKWWLHCQAPFSLHCGLQTPASLSPVWPPSSPPQATARPPHVVIALPSSFLSLFSTNLLLHPPTTNRGH